MIEPAVALTDYAVALECGFFAVLILRGGGDVRRLRPPLALFFAAIAAASICGGTVHGFFFDRRSGGHAFLWPATLLLSGLAGLAAWIAGSRLLWTERGAHRSTLAAVAALIVYGVLVISWRREFWMAIAVYMPALVFLAVALGAAWKRGESRGAPLALGGIGVAMTAALLQRLRVGIDEVHFDHNALYHIGQAIALGLFFLGCRRLVERPAAQRMRRTHEP